MMIVGQQAPDALHALVTASGNEGPAAVYADPYIAEPSRHPALIPRSSNPCNAETPASLLAANPITPTDLFYVRNHLPVPQVRAGHVCRRPLHCTQGFLQQMANKLALSAVCGLSQICRCHPISSKAKHKFLSQKQQLPGLDSVDGMHAPSQSRESNPWTYSWLDGVGKSHCKPSRH